MTKLKELAWIKGWRTGPPIVKTKLEDDDPPGIVYEGYDLLTFPHFVEWPPHTSEELVRIFVTNKVRERGPWIHDLQVERIKTVQLETAVRYPLLVHQLLVKIATLYREQPFDEILIKIRRARRPSMRKALAVLFNRLLYCQKSLPLALSWWSPPLSSNAKAEGLILLGQPDLLYLQHGLELGRTLKFSKGVVSGQWAAFDSSDGVDKETVAWQSVFDP